MEKEENYFATIKLSEENLSCKDSHELINFPYFAISIKF